jgi:glutamate 5-kinase
VTQPDVASSTTGSPVVEGDIRQAVRTARRIVVKVGSSSLTLPPDGSGPGGIDEDRLQALVTAIAARRAGGCELVLVSSGAIAAGLMPLGLPRRPRDLATQQAAASVGQGMLVARYAAAFARLGMVSGQVLLTADDVMRRSHYVNARRTLERLLHLGVVPVVNENDTVATHEIRFGDNDRLAALVAHLVSADVLVLLSDVDSLYDGPPSRPGAQRVAVVRGPADLEGIRIGSVGSQVATGGMVTKVEAAAIATAAGIPTLLTSAALVEEALGARDVGTWFEAQTGRTKGRMLWLAHAARPEGSLLLDAGAVAAVVQRRMSLLPAGVTGVQGRFLAGDPVDLRGPSGLVVARGMVNYDAEELPPLLGRSTRELARELGPEYERELVHRDDIVLLPDGDPRR